MKLDLGEPVHFYGPGADLSAGLWVIPWGSFWDSLRDSLGEDL